MYGPITSRSASALASDRSSSYSTPSSAKRTDSPSPSASSSPSISSKIRTIVLVATRAPRRRNVYTSPYRVTCVRPHAVHAQRRDDSRSHADRLGERVLQHAYVRGVEARDRNCLGITNRGREPLVQATPPRRSVDENTPPVGEVDLAVRERVVDESINRARQGRRRDASPLAQVRHRRRAVST